MGIQEILNSKPVTKFVLRLGHFLPPKPGYRVAHLIGTYLGKRTHLTPVKAVRANQWVISGGQGTGADLDRLARGTYQGAARWIYDFYQYMSEAKGMLDRVEF